MRKERFSTSLPRCKIAGAQGCRIVKAFMLISLQFPHGLYLMGQHSVLLTKSL
jgi:hypothetical protein